jgi:hypothetical protein
MSGCKARAGKSLLDGSPMTIPGNDSHQVQSLSKHLLQVVDRQPRSSPMQHPVTIGADEGKILQSSARALPQLRDGDRVVALDIPRSP